MPFIKIPGFEQRRGSDGDRDGERMEKTEERLLSCRSTMLLYLREKGKGGGIVQEVWAPRIGESTRDGSQGEVDGNGERAKLIEY